MKIPHCLCYDSCVHGVVKSIEETGSAMDKRYRETALGGLAADYERSLQQTPQLHFVQDLCGFMTTMTISKKMMKIE